jgi:hypothetical protein
MAREREKRAPEGSRPAPIEFEPVAPGQAPLVRRCAVMLDCGDGLYEVAIVELTPDGRWREVWRNFPQMVHFALAEMRRQQEKLIVERSTLMQNGVPVMPREPA